ncbi:MAG: 30S ribosome-binding factor RbfA [Planctomycetes bacterium]|nr:30S ribosome-binding factor RbfA [Planctomycetota bacterium]MCK5473029.1 30S ribosome-binding factor RbfA [Planctomycetota bacterium]
MPTRRQEKVARAIKESVSDAITNHLNDPRIKGFVSVTAVDTTPDLRSADVYLSVFGTQSETVANTTFIAIKHSKSKIQSLLGKSLTGKFCPVLRFHKDEVFKKTIDTMKLINQAVDEFKDKEENTDPK